MLVLQRKKNQAIILGGDIEIVVTEIKGDSIKIGIKAPSSVPVFRKEVYEMIQKENKAASDISPTDLDKALPALSKSSQ